MKEQLETLNKLAEVIEQADRKLETIEATSWCDITFTLKQRTRHKIEVMQKVKQRLRERWMRVVNQLQREIQTQTKNILTK